ncbi:major facilitator superfamily domain-containing protein 1 [Heterostelium album PN500]|uniref:Lysosomal dipeptide transporter MFSD1 n=1 Tax=Heterostelium pallidum (strain ATCC 26659 / Pp 5 / PN500) TaxID=670386 RepID=D3BL98_HETP5|nr:major facilitator superfamily domain-containing protein 1 [Heterostelium album PN500]EFA77832.1 major facilitator superfamily domain-containing protein 1 [Heterostelium album PN500]|eukprot:XP_020429960.1 major facilitator superfamily domain-containing protein 1 [Heterostelium album PN500]
MSEVKQPWTEHAFRYLGLFFICMMTFGSYYIYDIPSALTQDKIDTWYGVKEIKYSLLYAVYNFPNMVIVFFGGFLIDTVFGLKLGSIIFCCLVMTGQILFSISANSKTFWLALLGRTIFGLGGESLSVAQSTFCAAWFNGRNDLNLAFAITLGFSRIGSAVNFQVTPTLDNKFSLPTAVWFGAICCGISFVACIVLCFLDMARSRKDAANNPVIKNDPVSIKDITKFPKMVWLIFALVVFFYVPLFVFVSIGTQFFVNKFGTTSSFAGVLTSIPYYTAAPSPVIGFIIDRVGRNLSWMALSMILLVVAHSILGFTMVNPYVGMILMGFSYAIMAASIWPTIPALIPSSRLGTAYGLAFAFQNAAIALSGLLVNAILEKTNNNYYYTEAIFVGSAAIGLLIVVLLILIDLKEKKLNIPSQDMKDNIKLLNKQSEPLLSEQSSINNNQEITY